MHATDPSYSIHSLQVTPMSEERPPNTPVNPPRPVHLVSYGNNQWSSRETPPQLPGYNEITRDQPEALQANSIEQQRVGARQFRFSIRKEEREISALATLEVPTVSYELEISTLPTK